MSTPLPSVGKVLLQRGSTITAECSATLVGPHLLLTAAHCVYDQTVGYVDQVWFAPGASHDPSAAFGVNAANGWWKATRWWASTGWTTADDAATDWALVELSPEDGSDPGARVGYWPVVTGLRWTPGTRTYLVGYPAAGTFSTAEYAAGAGQYACDSTYNGWTHLGTGTMLWSPCTMTGGASGGAWFAYYNGQWVIAGIIDRCYRDANGCEPYASWNLSPSLGSAFLQFWNTVVPQT